MLFEAIPHRFYCDFSNGIKEVKVVSTVAEKVRDHFSGYVKVGKRVEPKDQYVRLHYGRARVFVKANDGEVIKLCAELDK